MLSIISKRNDMNDRSKYITSLSGPQPPPLLKFLMKHAFSLAKKMQTWYFKDVAPGHSLAMTIEMPIKLQVT